METIKLIHSRQKTLSTAKATMGKKELKEYINQAVDALTEEELRILFPERQQPDLYTMVEEFIGLKGEVKKQNQSSLKNNNSVLAAIEKMDEEKERISEEEIETIKQNILEETEKERKHLMLQIMEQDDLIGRTETNFKQLPEAEIWELSEFKSAYHSWQRGYEITNEKWGQFLNDLGLKKNGLPGEMFNPQFHEAIDVKNNPEKPDNIILETEVTGFIYQNKIIRTAKVIVNKTT